LKKVNVGKSNLMASRLILGCMRISKLSLKETEDIIFTAMENGIDLLDNADYYAGGQAEEKLGEVIKLHPELRDKIKIQTKCSIRRVGSSGQKTFDYSKEHILEAVDDSLRRMNLEYLDMLLLHRPDPLMEPEEVAEAFSILIDKGKVRNFGVSNHNPGQIRLLEKYIKYPIIANQLELSILNSGMIHSGMNVNMTNERSIDHDGGILEYCRLNDITIQAWSPFLSRMYKGERVEESLILDKEKFPTLNSKLEEIAENRNVTSSAIAVAWILRHPAKMQTIIGTTKSHRLAEICKADEIELTREEWYSIYSAAGFVIP